MGFKTSFAFIAALACVGGNALAADLPAGAKDAIDAAYKLNCAAALNPTDANMDASFAVVAKDYQYEPIKGDKQSRDEALAQGKQMLKTIHTTKCDVTVDNEAVQPDGSIQATTTLKADGDIQAPNGKHDFSALSRSVDTWKLVDGKWMNTYSKELKNLVKMDGNVVQDEGN